jgi:NitT/TauT family transport system ATP-binding protein
MKMLMVKIIVSRLMKRFDNKLRTKEVMRDIDMVIEPGQVIAIRGDNGTGKTTLLNMLVGIEKATSGSVRYAEIQSEALRIGYVQQDYTSSLLPWLDVLDNVSIPLRLRGINRGERRDRASNTLDSLQFTNLPKMAYPHELSGGQKQRVALARAIVHDPHLLILDEPFANLDAHTSRDLQESIAQIHEAYKPTIIYVSHDLDHIFLADRVFLLHGSPAELNAEFAIVLPRPRSRKLLLDSQYTQVRANILAHEEMLYAKQGPR